ncbi:hypothetical protein [Streptomyces macrosporus]|uniref:Lipoprotein n=1 Tax=Streptomyces macrosporus TaxID=44032 RepID=A0ABN3JMW4_9ACTN
MVTCRTARLVRPALVSALAACALTLPAAPAALGEEPSPRGTGTASPDIASPDIAPPDTASPDTAGTASVRITPATARPGAEVTVVARGCKGTVGTARSEAFVADARLAPSADGGLFGEARIRSDAEERRYRVTVECEGVEGRPLTGRLTVRRSASGPPSSPAASPSASPAVSPTGTPTAGPIAPVPAGGGGTAERAEDAGPGALHTALGAGLAGAAALAVAWRALSSRRRDRSDADH